MKDSENKQENKLKMYSTSGLNYKWQKEPSKPTLEKEKLIDPDIVMFGSDLKDRQKPWVPAKYQMSWRMEDEIEEVVSGQIR